jgi:hypothetical protein
LGAAQTKQKIIRTLKKPSSPPQAAIITSNFFHETLILRNCFKTYLALLLFIFSDHATSILKEI